MISYYNHFVLPFTIGVAILFSVVIYKYVRWFFRLDKSDKKLLYKGILSKKSLLAIKEVFYESLLHIKIFKVNPLLGFMHASLAFGWFMLIVVGWIETTILLRGAVVPPHVHVFFKFFAPLHDPDSDMVNILGSVMDALLVVVLMGVALAWFKRVRSKSMGIKRTTKHIFWDRMALSALWFIFPIRLIAESVTSGLVGSHTFLTGSFGAFLMDGFGRSALQAAEPIAWWTYSILLGVFFVSMPFSRYMHIFTEIPLIFMRAYGLRSKEQEGSYDHFQIEACSRCGICLDPCQLQTAGFKSVQSVYFLRDRRYNCLEDKVTNNCLMCGRCEGKCPVGIELNTLRLNSRSKIADGDDTRRYDYIKDVDRSIGEGKVGYFAGCMTLLLPKVLIAMNDIFEKANEQVWWADKDGGVCCGRPLKLSGELSAAKKMFDYNTDLFKKHNIKTLVTSCPICLKVFKEDYLLEGIELLHHSQYILRLMEQGRIKPKLAETLFTYHDPCELGRGLGIYNEPREVIKNIGGLVEAEQHRQDAKCCGSSLANLQISDSGTLAIAKELGMELDNTGADTIVTACPLCKKAVARGTERSVKDISEIVSQSI